MAAAAVMALMCFVSSNPSPQHWLVSGRVEAVARMDAVVATLTDIRRIAHAEDGDTGFSRYELGANPSNQVLWPLISHADHDNMVYSRFQHIVPSCPSGERSEVGDRRSALAMGLIGPVEAIRQLGFPPGTALRNVQLEDGRTGLGFALRDADRDVYDGLVSLADEGKLEGIDLVMMRPRGDIPREPERTGRTDHMGTPEGRQ